MGKTGNTNKGGVCGREENGSKNFSWEITMLGTGH